MIESAGTYAAMSTLTGCVHQSHAKMTAASTQTMIRARRTISIRAHPNRRPKHQARRPQAERLRADAALAFARLRPRKSTPTDAPPRRRLCVQIILRAPPGSWKSLVHNPEKPPKPLKMMGVKQGKIVIDTGRRGDL